MSAVLLAVFDEYKVAERVRVELVRDGFPTDRVELTAGCEPGRAGLEPADSPHGRFVQYFRVLFTFEDERHHAEELAKRVDDGAATITVHPRGSMETARATQILLNAPAVQLISHDLANQTPRCAIAKRARLWILGAPTVCLFLTGYLVNKQGFAQIDLPATRAQLRLEQAQETVPDETEFPPERYSHSRYISAVIARYLDTHLGPGELSLERPSNRYRPVDELDSDWWTLRNRAANSASCLGGRSAAGTTLDEVPSP
jgi:hypothetical protein